MERSDHRIGYVLVLISALGSCLVVLFAKAAYALGLNLETILFWRFAASALLMSVLYKILVKHKLSPRLAISSTLMGAFGYSASALCFFKAASLVPASMVSVLLYTFPAMVVVIDWLTKRVIPNQWRLLALVLSFMGCVLVVSPDGFGEVHVMGAVFGLGAAFFYACYVTASQYVLRGTNPIAVSFFVVFGAMLSFGVVGLFQRAIEVPDTLQSSAIIISLAVVSTVLPTVTMLYGVQRIGSAQASIVSTIEPVFTLLLSYFLLSERLSQVQLLGSAAVVASLLILSFKKK